MSKDRKSGGNLLGGVGPKHDLDSIESGVDSVLVSAGIELIFLPVAEKCLGTGFSTRRMLITLVFLVVTMK